MEYIIIAIDPALYRIGEFSLRWYGVMIALGIAAGIFLALREARRKGVDEDATYNAALIGIIGAVIGARLLHVIDRSDYYVIYPNEIPLVQQGGLAIWGAIIGGFAFAALYARWRRLPIGKLADVAAPALLIGQLIGRLGGIINGDAYGAPFDAPWAFMYLHDDTLLPDLGIPTHPFPLYEIIWNALVLGVLWRLRTRNLPDGTIFLLYIVAYAVGRFALTFVRQEQIWFAGLQEAQIMSILAFVVAVPLLLRRVRAIPPAPPPAPTVAA